MQQIKLLGFSLFQYFLIFSDLSIFHCEAFTRGYLLTNRDVIKSIMREAELKQIFSIFSGTR